MVPAGQWQTVKDTLSRPNGRSLTISDAFGNLTSTVYSLRLTIDTAIFYVDIILSIQQSIKLPYSDYHSNLRHYPSIDTATHHITIPTDKAIPDNIATAIKSVTILLLIQQAIMLLYAQ